ncbi:MAG: hypothetical protein NC120_14170 [Ruminococcus sp.]|nr:hypothetical protein [Ruminococcus sp.]
MMDYKKVVYTLVEEKMHGPWIYYALLVLFNLLVILMGIGDPDNTHILFMFMSITTMYTMMMVSVLQFAYPLIGSDSTGKGISAAMQVREIFGGANTPYEMLCVMPCTHREIGKYVFKMLRIITATESVFLVLYTLIFGGAYTTAMFICYPLSVMALPMLFTVREKRVNITGWVIYFTGMAMVLASVFADIFELQAFFFIPVYAKLIFALLPVVFNEIFCRCVLLNKNRLYARNGERVRH